MMELSAEAAGSRQKQRQHVGTVLANNNETLKKHRDREGEKERERKKKRDKERVTEEGRWQSRRHSGNSLPGKWCSKGRMG